MTKIMPTYKLGNSFDMYSLLYTHLLLFITHYLDRVISHFEHKICVTARLRSQGVFEKALLPGSIDKTLWCERINPWSANNLWGTTHSVIKIRKNIVAKMNRIFCSTSIYEISSHCSPACRNRCFGNSHF